MPTRPKLLCLAFLAHCALPEAAPAPATYSGVNLTAPGVGCAEALPGGRVDFRSTAYELCIRDYEVCLGVYSPDCDGGPFTLCKRVSDGEPLAEAPHARGCVAQMDVATAAAAPPAPAPPAVGPGAALILPASTISFDAVNTQNCDNVTCTLEGQSDAASCRQHMVNLMKGNSGSGTAPSGGASCDAAHKVLSRSTSCHACFSCELCEQGLAGNLLPQELFQEQRRRGPSGRIESVTAARGVVGLPLRRFGLVVAAAIAAGSAGTLLLLSIKLSRRWRAQPALHAEARGMGYTDALDVEESAALAD